MEILVTLRVCMAGGKQQAAESQVGGTLSGKRELYRIPRNRAAKRLSSNCREAVWIGKSLAGFWQSGSCSDFRFYYRAVWFSTWGQFSPIPLCMGHLVMSGDIWGCQKWGSATGIW